MKYENIESAIFLNRPNRFIAKIRLKGQEVVCHVKNTGRCKELLVPGAKVYVERSTNPLRKTLYDLIAVQKGSLLINMDAQAPNQAAHEWLSQGGLGAFTFIKPETTYGNSRFDFYLEKGKKKGFLEVKGVTLEKDGVVSFPDAPTERGVKHIEELITCHQEGYLAYLLFVIQMEPVLYFRPNWETHPAFAQALLRAKAAGVKLLAYACHVTPSTMTITDKVKIKLKE
jgi:sugar fermentation stimulation protein A